jgi:hypothetical protein
VVGVVPGVLVTVTDGVPVNVTVGVVVDVGVGVALNVAVGVLEGVANGVADGAGVIVISTSFWKELHAGFIFLSVSDLVVSGTVMNIVEYSSFKVKGPSRNTRLLFVSR